MKPEYIGVGNFDTNNYAYAYCKCPLPMDYAIKWPLIKDGKLHRYSCTCEDCETEVGVLAKSGEDSKSDVLDKIKDDIEQDAFSNLNGSKYISVNRVNQIIDKYKAESEEN